MSDVFIHIGLPKTATTYMQQVIFPYWKDLNYMGKCEKFLKILDFNDEEKFLISNEGLCGFTWSGNWKERQKRFIVNLAHMLPNAKILLSLRKHDSYISSLYNQYLISGGYKNFKDFFDINKNMGVIKIEDLYFNDLINLINDNFYEKPFIFFQEDILNNLNNLLSNLSELFNIDKPTLNLDKKHMNIGINYYQGILLKNFNKICKYNKKFYSKIRYSTANILQNKIIIPKKKFSLTLKEKNFMDKEYKKDWQSIRINRSQLL